MFNNSIPIISFFVIIQLLLYTAFLLTGNKWHKTSSKILAGILITQALWIFDSSIFHAGKPLYRYFIHFLYTGESLSFFWGPGIFLYIKYLTRNDNKFRKMELFYFLPLMVHFGFMAYKFHFKPTSIKYELILNNEVLSYIELILSWGAYCINNIIFNVAAFYPLYKYKQQSKKNYTDTEKLNLSLLTLVLIGFLSKTIIESLRFLVFLNGMYDKIIPLYTITLIDSYIFISILIFGTLRRPEIFNNLKESFKYGSSPLSTSDVQYYSENLKVYMNQEKPYLEDSLNLEILASGVKIPPRYLSQVINQGFGQNFFDFINSYRIEYAIKQLSESKNNKTISEIYYEAGFRSKATFYKAFKKQLNITPTDFRKETILVSPN